MTGYVRTFVYEILFAHQGVKLRNKTANLGIN